jgi:hypothetical protein
VEVDDLDKSRTDNSWPKEDDVGE